MFLHIGENISIYKNDIIAILDKKVLETENENKRVIENLLEDSSIIKSEDTKTYILTCDKKGREFGKYNLYTSNISSTTLLNRR